MDFKKWYNENKCIFYHLLDGVINETSGNNDNQVISYIKTIINDFKLKIKIGTFNLDKGFPGKLELIIDDFKMQFLDGDLIQYTNSFSEYIKEHKFIIIPLGFQLHSISLVICFHEELYSLFLVNSGKGLETHFSFNDLCKPYIIISTKLINLILNIIYLIIFYFLINNNMLIPNTYLKKLHKVFRCCSDFFKISVLEQLNDSTIYKAESDIYLIISNLLNLIKQNYEENISTTMDELIIENLKDNDLTDEDIEKSNNHLYILNKIKFHYQNDNILIKLQ